MSYIDLYGRNPDLQATRFEYPSARMPLRMKGPLYFLKPESAAPVFGVPSMTVVDADETRVGLDPTSAVLRTGRNMGLGGIGADEVPAPSVPALTLDESKDCATVSKAESTYYYKYLLRKKGPLSATEQDWIEKYEIMRSKCIKGAVSEWWESLPHWAWVVGVIAGTIALVNVTGLLRRFAPSKE